MHIVEWGVRRETIIDMFVNRGTGGGGGESVDADLICVWVW